MRMRRGIAVAGAAGALLLAAGPARAAQAVDTGDTAWILVSTALVLFMTLPGLALFYGGLVRSKNVLSVLMQCFAISGVVSVVWLVYGYSLSFGPDLGGIVGGLGKALFASVGLESTSGTIPETVFAMFQLTFAIITPGLVIGAFAERTKFTAVLWFTVLWVTVVYAPVTHWVWGGGWLGKMGLLDFAGGTVVHVTAGAAALVCALVIGKRRGFPDTPMPPHNMTLTVAGAGMLWVGWYGFNAGSALAANANAGMALVATHMSASAGALTWMACEWKKFGKPSVLGVVTGMVAGLGTITPASGFVGPMGALAIGILAGFVCFNATLLVKQKFGIDDSLDVFPVHGVGGMLGTLLAGIFCSPNLGVFRGLGFAQGISSVGSQFGVQVVGVVATFVYTAVATFVILKVIDGLCGLRVGEEAEVQGLDLALHEERGYDL
ncbi:MAG: ammonium transporter [Candidatus Dadabacteria bacterium]|nr:MAG: ammonium transporter [Candidatus Dadabacteria bacterium]